MNIAMNNQRRQSPNTGDEATNEPPITRRLSRISRTESVVSFSENTVFERRTRSDSNVSFLDEQINSSSFPNNRGNDGKTYPKTCFKKTSTRSTSSTSSTSQTNEPKTDMNNSRRGSFRRLEMNSSNYEEHESPVHKGKPVERQDLWKDSSIILDMLIGFEVDVAAPRVRRRSIARRSALSTASHPSDTWSTGDADTDDDVEDDCDKSLTKEDETRIFQCSELLSQRIPEDSDNINLASKDQIRRSSKIVNAVDTRRRHTLNYCSGRPSFEFSGKFAKVSKSLPNIALWKNSTFQDNERIVTDNANEEFAIDLKSKDEKAPLAKRFSFKQTLSFFQKVADDYEKKGDKEGDKEKEENVLLKNLKKIDSNNLLSIYRDNKEDDSSDDEQ